LKYYKEKYTQFIIKKYNKNLLWKQNKNDDLYEHKSHCVPADPAYTQCDVLNWRYLKQPNLLSYRV
jgi:hypothetical protein